MTSLDVAVLLRELGGIAALRALHERDDEREYGAVVRMSSDEALLRETIVLLDVAGRCWADEKTRSLEDEVEIVGLL
ncbi:hypothetical protein PanWU01x14_196540 [Parasponia andersonii]|uniref:Uncharacterized protein n=1 Tax=Parasponia andersonii TaxID=3476 RepID=A0A2P5BZQ1_PARAD|nr:hypothetical protein PanWU01x14_196540 [Parasponia andersonii]